jgi:hypothetical protein
LRQHMATIEHVESHVGIQAEDVDCRHACQGRMLIQSTFSRAGSATGVTVGPRWSVALLVRTTRWQQPAQASPKQVIHPLPATNG